MDGKFIYVFRDSDRDALLEAGCELLKADAENHTYVFVNPSGRAFSCGSATYALSDLLTF